MVVPSRPWDVVPHLLHNVKACGNLQAHMSDVTVLCNVEESLSYTFSPSRPSDAAMHCQEHDCDIAEHLLGTKHAHAHLPCEQEEVEGVEGDVGCAGSLVASRHGWHQRGCGGPQHHYGCSSVQVGTREQLA